MGPGEVSCESGQSASWALADSQVKRMCPDDVRFDFE